MHKGRLEAFSDGVIAIIITIMVLELKVPHGAEIESLRGLLPIFICYTLSFIFIGIYWNNHHHLLQAVHKTNGPVLWANLHLLFWLSIVPVVTAWMGENPFAPWPVALYGVVLLGSAIAYTILTICLVRLNGKDSALGKAIESDTKGKLSLILYATAISVAFINSYISCALYAVVAIIWLVPDSRIEKALK